MVSQTLQTPQGPFDEQLMLARLQRAVKQKPGFVDFLFAHAGQDAVLRLGAVARTFKHALSLGNLANPVVPLLQASSQIENITQIEPFAAPLTPVTPDTGPDHYATFDSWEPQEPLYDLALSLIVPSFVNDLPAMMRRMRLALCPDGLFMMCLLGPRTLDELRQAFLIAESEAGGAVVPHVAPFTNVRIAGTLAQRAGLALVVCDRDTLTVRYETPLHVLQDLRRMGATNNLQARSRKFMPREIFLHAMQIYRERFSDTDGRVRATFEFVWISAWAPDTHHPQPLKPGSASHSLASALHAFGDDDTGEG